MFGPGFGFALGCTSLFACAALIAGRAAQVETAFFLTRVGRSGAAVEGIGSSIAYRPAPHSGARWPQAGTMP